MADPKAALWTCPACGRFFANANQSHACGRHALEPHFEGRSAKVRAIYDAFLAMLEDFGPVTVLPEKTRIAFQVRMSFAQLTIRRDWVLGHLVLARRVEDPLFTRIETFSPRNHLHAFRLDEPGEVEGLKDHAREAYAVGRQEHLARDAFLASAGKKGLDGAHEDARHRAGGRRRAAAAACFRLRRRHRPR